MGRSNMRPLIDSWVWAVIAVRAVKSHIFLTILLVYPYLHSLFLIRENNRNNCLYRPRHYNIREHGMAEMHTYRNLLPENIHY